MQRLVCPQAVGRSGDSDGAAGDDQIVVCGNAVLVARRDRERAAAVDGEIVVREDRAVRPVVQSGLGIALPAGEAVFTALRQGQEDLVRIVDAQARVVRAGDVHSVKHQPDLGRVLGVHDDAAVRKRAADHIAPGACDDHVPVIGVGTAAVYSGSLPLQGDHGGAVDRPAARQIVCREVGAAGIALGILVHDDLNSQALAVDEQDGDRYGQQQHDNADKIKQFMR